jgi:hypothetical protein
LILRAALLGGLFAALGCGVKARDVPLPAPSTSAPPGPPPTVASPPPPPVPSLEQLASRQVRLAPGMRELLHAESVTPLPLPSVERDTCVRVSFAAAAPVSVSLVATDGEILASARGAEGALDRTGPVCFHANRAPHLAFDGDAGAVRCVVWAAP